MGGHNSVDYAQATHTALLKKFGGLVSEQQIVYGRPFPLGLLLHGIYIDDNILLYLCPREALHDKGGPDRILVQKCHEVYRAAQLPITKDKAFGVAREADASAPREINFTAWGTQVNGEVCFVGSSFHQTSIDWVYHVGYQFQVF